MKIEVCGQTVLPDRSFLCTKMSHLNFLIFAFFINFVLKNMTFLVTLFDHKLQVFKNSPNWTIFWHFWLTFGHSKCKHSSLRSQCWMRLFVGFSSSISFGFKLGIYFLTCLSNSSVSSFRRTEKCNDKGILKTHPDHEQISENCSRWFSLTGFQVILGMLIKV